MKSLTLTQKFVALFGALAVCACIAYGTINMMAFFPAYIAFGLPEVANGHLMATVMGWAAGAWLTAATVLNVRSLEPKAGARLGVVAKA